MSNEKFTAHRYPWGHWIGFSITAGSLTLADVVRHAIATMRLGVEPRW
jgi:hypothetical protein